MILRISFLIILLSCILATNCVGEKIVSPVDHFFKNNPESQKKYVALYQTSFEYIILKTHKQYSMSLSTLERVEEAFPDSNELIDYIDKTKVLMEKDRDEIISLFKDLQKRFSKKDEYLYWFVYTDGSTDEAGFLVLKNGEIIFREPYTGP